MFFFSSSPSSNSLFLEKKNKRFVNVIKDEIRQAQGNEEYYFGNPINSHLFIKHLTSDWYNIEEILPAGCNNPINKIILIIYFS